MIFFFFFYLLAYKKEEKDIKKYYVREKTKPASQLGSFISWNKTKGLEVGVTLGKDSVNLSVKPLFIEARILTIFFVFYDELIKALFWIGYSLLVFSRT